ncbi:MAG TPA: glycoside hydrolase family 11 protein [Bacteroidales bacterium]|nr:glycoside hydrolase family 11 protein [Bacteroidales bacterium]
MKIRLGKNLLTIFMSGAVLLTPLLFPPAAAQKTVCANEIGTEGGYSYELWKQKNDAESCMTLKDGFLFSCEWKESSENFLARRGFKYDTTQTPSQIGNFVASFACNYNPSGNSYLAVYGWTVSPLVEFYIIESWGTWRPPGATSKGTITVDGGTYDIYQTTRENQASIKGTATFQQYWSVRRTKRTSGNISIFKHFEKWEEMNMPLGKLYDINLLIEGYKSSGNAEFTSATIDTNGDPTAVNAIENNTKQNSPLSVSVDPSLNILDVNVLKASGSPIKANIYSISGTLLKKVELVSGNNKIDINDLQKGLYLLSTSINNEVIAQKFLK